LDGFKRNIEGELHKDCQNIIDTIKNDVLKEDKQEEVKQEAVKQDAVKQEAEEKTFFLKMVGDYYRYMAENPKNEIFADAKKCALDYY
jgi:hypothetical protein